MFCINLLYGEGLTRSYKKHFDSKQAAWCYTKACLSKAAIKGETINLAIYENVGADSYKLLFCRTLEITDEPID